MTDKLYLITQAQIDELLSIDVTAESKALLQSLPMVEGEPVDLDLARAMCRSSGISLVSRDFIERFADFVSDWKKGDFTLPKYAEIDMQSCFDAWQAFDPDLATSPQTLTLITADELGKLHHIENFGLFCSFDEFEQIARAIEHKHGIVKHRSEAKPEWAKTSSYPELDLS